MIDGGNATKRHSYGRARDLVNELVSARFDCDASSAVELGESVVVCTLVQGRRITTQ